jgi:hypothetical protein
MCAGVLYAQDVRFSQRCWRSFRSSAMTPCGLVYQLHCFGVSYVCIFREVYEEKVSSSWTTLIIDAAVSSKTLVRIYQYRRRHILEDL